MHVGRLAEGKPQLMILSVDQPVPDSALEKIKGVRGVLSAKAVTL